MKNIIAALLLFFSFNAFAESSNVAIYFSGNQLINGARLIGKTGYKTEELAYFEMFDGYVSGVFDTLSNNKIICPVGDRFIPREQVLAIAAKYLLNEPEKWNFPATILIEESFKKTFPCKK